MSSVVIKSFSNGIKLFFDDSVSFDILIEDIKKKFEESAVFFKNSKLAVSFEGRIFSDDEEKEIVKIMEESAGMSVLYIIGKDDETGEHFKKNLSDAYFNDDNVLSDCHIYRGNVKNSERLEFHSSVLITGDVDPGCSIKASGDIIILGGLYGYAYAGYGNDESHFVFANEMAAQKLSIGKIVFYPKKKPIWSIRPKYLPKLAFVKDGIIVVENCSRETLGLL